MFRGWLTLRKSRKVAQRLLAGAGASPTLRRVHDGNRTLFVVETGARAQRPVMFIHGSPGSWTDFVQYLADPDLRRVARLLAVDRPGYGDSEPGRPVTSLTEQARLIAGALSGPPAVIVAHSMGGPIAVRMAVDAGARVAGLILLAPPLDPQLEQVHWLQRLAGRKWIASCLPSAVRTSNREQLALVSELTALKTRWSGLTLPVVLIHGDHDLHVSDAHLMFAHRQLENVPVRTHHLPGADHYLPWTHHRLIRDTILRLLDRLDAAHRSCGVTSLKSQVSVSGTQDKLTR